MKSIKKFLLMSLVLLSVITISCKKTNGVSDSVSSGNGSGNYNPTKTEQNEILKTESDNKENEVLVAFFTGYDEIEKFAYVISDYVMADLYKINPTIDYTDMDYLDDENSRIYTEQRDNVRPAISNKMKNIKKYKYVFLGFPIWYDKAPRIILNFLESFDFTNKTIIPFCMSDEFDVNNSIAEIRNILGNNVEVLNGINLTSKTLLDDVTKQVDELNIEFKVDDRYDEE